MNRRRIVMILVVVVIVVLGVVVFQMFGDDLGTTAMGQYAPGDYFVTNIDGSNRLLKTSVVLILDTDNENGTLETEHTRIRDTIIFILRQQDEDTLKATGTPDQLREQIKKELNGMLWEEDEHIVEVLFSEYVIQ